MREYLRKSAMFLVAVLFSTVVCAQEGLLGDIPAAELPIEARETIALIKEGGPFPYAKDRSIFGNYEGHLPRKRRGYYREYTVKTPGLTHRGPRRIVSGGTPTMTAEFYYTADHYRSFRYVVEEKK